MISFTITWKNIKKYFRYRVSPLFVRFANGVQLIMQLIINCWAGLISKKVKRNIDSKPLCLLIGHERSGKTSLLNALSNDEEKITLVKEVHRVKLWQLNDTTFIEMSDGTAHKSKQKIACLSSVLKKLIASVILTFNIIEFMRDADVAWKKISGILDECLLGMDNLFVSKPVVYIVFTQCDRMAGFLELFDDLSDQEKRNALGVSFPLSIAHDADKYAIYFEKQCDSINQYLSHRVVEALFIQKSSLSRDYLYLFQQQVKHVFSACQKLLESLVSSDSTSRFIILRGFYFTSAKQKSLTERAILSSTRSDQHPITINNAQPKRIEQSQIYFIHDLFHKTIFVELGSFYPKTDIKKTTYYTIATFLLVFLMSCSVMACVTYKQDKQYIQAINQSLEQYYQDLQYVRMDDDSLVFVLPVIGQLKKVQRITSQCPWLASLFIADTFDVRSAVNASIKRSLDLLFIPRVVIQLEKKLRKHDSNKAWTFNMLMAYEQFYRERSIKFNQVLFAVMYLIWKQQFPFQNELRLHLNQYFRVAVNNNHTHFPLDTLLIDHTSDRINSLSTMARAYALLSLLANASDIKIPIFDQKGRVFDIHSKKYLLPNLFTQEAYQQILLRHIYTISNLSINSRLRHTAYNSFEKGMLIKKFSVALKKDYIKRYYQQWQDFLGGIDLRKVDDLKQLVALMNNFINPDSEINTLLHFIMDNDLSSNSKVRRGFFASLDDFYQRKDERMRLHKDLVKMTRDFSHLSQKKDVNQASFFLMKSFFINKNSNFQYLVADTQVSPEPLKNWLTHLCQMALTILNRHAVAQANDIWRKNVLSYYQRFLYRHYPFDHKSIKQASLPTFNHMFSRSGLIAQYYSSYIQPFVRQKSVFLKIRSKPLMTLSPQSLRFLRHWRLIQEQFFHFNSSRASIHFSVLPRVLSENASRAVLALGGKKINYQHGPRYPLQISWPFPLRQQRISFIIDDFHGNHYSYSINGAWSLLKLFQYANLRKDQQSKNMTLQFELSGYSAIYDLTLSYPAQQVNLSILANLKFPRDLLTF